MKKMLLTSALIVGMLFCISTVAGAYSMWDIAPGDQTILIGHGPFNVVGYGGEFDMQARQQGTGLITSFNTWCAEASVTQNMNTWYTIDDPFLDPSDQSAWLLWQYFNGTGVITISGNTEEIAFQQTLWYYDDPASFTPTVDISMYKDPAEAAVTTGWTNINHVYIADLYNGGDRQNVYVPGVPIPPAALLLASGLLGLIGIRRFKNQG